MIKRYKKTLTFIIGIILILSIIIFSIMKSNTTNYKNIKEDKNKYLVYTKYEKQNDKYEVYIPYINIDYIDIKVINEEISNYVNKFLTTSKVNVMYEYNISGKILSLVIKVVNYDTSYAPVVYFKTINIDLKTKTELVEDDLLQKFNTDLYNVELVVEKDLKKYYKKLIEEDYYEEDECNFNCFLANREIDNILDDISYYVKDGNLYVYKPFITYSIFGEEDFFKEKHFIFKITNN